MTFVSSHVYPGADGASPANATGLLNDNNARLAQIASGGYTTATVKSFNTEWNSAYSGQGGNPGDANLSMDNHWNAGFILKGVKLLSDQNQGDTPPLDVFSYWVLSDIFDESGGPSGSYILGQGGDLPFGRVFGLMTFQGVRKAAFNAFKMLNYLGPRRLMSGGGTGGDGVDAMATTSASARHAASIARRRGSPRIRSGTATFSAAESVGRRLYCWKMKPRFAFRNRVFAFASIA